VIVLSLANLASGHSFLSTATLGQEHYSNLIGIVADKIQTDGPGALVGIDLSNLPEATASYIKAVALLPFLAGMKFAMPSLDLTGMAPDSAALQPLNVFPVFLNPSADWTSGLDAVFGREGFCCVVADAVENDTVPRARILGHADRAVLQTLQAVRNHTEIRASELHAATDEGITVTAWNNRLADLWTRRLIRRTRAGNSWKYQPFLTGEILYGLPVHSGN